METAESKEDILKDVEGLLRRLLEGGQIPYHVYSFLHEDISRAVARAFSIGFKQGAEHEK